MIVNLAQPSDMIESCEPHKRITIRFIHKQVWSVQPTADVQGILFIGGLSPNSASYGGAGAPPGSPYSVVLSRGLDNRTSQLRRKAAAETRTSGLRDPPRGCLSGDAPYGEEA